MAGKRETSLLFLAPRGARLGALGIPDFVGDEVADTFNAVSQEAQRTGIDKVGMYDSLEYRASGSGLDTWRPSRSWNQSGDSTAR